MYASVDLWVALPIGSHIDKMFITALQTRLPPSTPGTSQIMERRPPRPSPARWRSPINRLESAPQPGHDGRDIRNDNQRVPSAPVA